VDLLNRFSFFAILSILALDRHPDQVFPVAALTVPARCVD
jgi:hypothetical protein